jgi:hypothetical protein
MVRHARRRAATAAFLVALLAVAGEGGAVDAPMGPGADEKAAPSASSTRLRVVFDRLAGGAPDAHETNHLRVISRALASRDAFEIVRAAPPGSVPRVPAPSSATDADDVDAVSEAFAEVDVFWDFEPGDAPRALRAGQRANHFPGSGAMTSKATLATLRLEGPGAARVPATLAPDWSSPEDVRRAAEDAANETDAWLAKRATHGDVRVLRHAPNESSLASSLAATLARGDVAQRRVRRPLRVDGRAFDLGVYVFARGAAPREQTESDGESDGEIGFFPPVFSGARGDVALDKTGGPISVPSVGVWEAFEFDETLLRFVGDARAADDLLGREYPAAWDVPTLARLGAGSKQDAPTAWRALARVLDARYGAGAAAAVRRRATETIVAAMDAAAPFVASAIHDANANASGNAEKRAPFPDRAAHFFETFRFDFVLDDGSASADGLPTPWLVEVNASPNLKPASAPQEDVLSRLCAKLADALAPARRGAADPTDADAAFARLALRDGGALVPGTDDGNGNTQMTSSAPRGRRLVSHSESHAEDVDCVVSAWGDWGSCSPCGDGGQRTRSREITTAKAENGDACPALTETQSCTTTTTCPPPPPTSMPPPPPPSPPSPPPPPPAWSRTLDARLELVGFAGAFDAAAQAATASAVAEEIAERVSLSAGLNVTDVVVVSYGFLARLEVVLRRRESEAESDWSPLADALAADAGVSPASRVVLGVAGGANATFAFEVSVASVASAAAGASLASLAASAAADGTSAFASRANETGYAVVDAAAVGSVTATAVRVTLVAMTQTDASSADAALDFGVSAVENALRVAVDAGSVAAKLRARGFDVDASAGAYADRFDDDALFVGSEDPEPLRDASLDSSGARGAESVVLAAFASVAAATFLF